MTLNENNIYIETHDLSTNQLEDLWWFINNLGYKTFRKLEEFKDYSNGSHYLGFSAISHRSGLIYEFCDLGGLIPSHRTKVTLEEFKDILQPIEKFKPISMSCSFEQYQSILPKLKGISRQPPYYNSEGQDLFLTNNFNYTPYNVNCIHPDLRFNADRKCYEQWDERLFLHYCGVKVDLRKGDTIIITDLGNAATLNTKLNTPYVLCEDFNEQNGLMFYSKDSNGNIIKDGWDKAHDLNIKVELYPTDKVNIDDRLEMIRRKINSFN